MIKSEDLTFPKIKEKINKAGNLFYQYRACRRDAATIYDIENIRHGVVYARTPLQMNDPFDSMVGFSSEKIYDECIDLALDQAADSLDENLKLVIKSLLKYRLIGKTVEFIDALNKLKKYIFVQSVIEHVSVANIPLFIMKNVERLYKKSPADVKRYFDKSTFCDTTLLEVVQDDAVIPTKNRNVIIILFIELLFRFYMQIISFLY